MLNVEKFTIRGFVSQITELMEAAGLQVEEEFMDVGDSGVEVSQGVDIPQGDTSLDDLPEFKDISLTMMTMMALRCTRKNRQKRIRSSKIWI